MKNILFFLSILFFNYRVFAQIPNAGFEDWLPNQACQRPQGWHTVFSEIDSSGTYCPVQPSDEHFPPDSGQRSIRIANDTALWNSGVEPNLWLGWGIVFSSRLNDRPLFPVQGRPLSFSGYYRFLPENLDTLNLRAFLYLNGNEISSAWFQSSSPAPQWTAFHVLFNDTNYLDVDSARITLSSSNEPKDGSKGPRGNSVLWVDNIRFNQAITGISPGIPFPQSQPLFHRWSSESGALVIGRTAEAAARTGRLQFIDLTGRLLGEAVWPANQKEFQFDERCCSGSTMMVRYDDGKFRALKFLFKDGW